MKRICVSKFFSMILLTFVLPIILISCSAPAPEDENQQEAQTEASTVSDLNFNSTSEDVVNQLGSPSEITSAPGVGVYSYKEGPHKGITICFIGDKAFSFGIENGDLTAPKGVKVGVNIVKALREYYIPQELIALGVSEDDADGVILQKIIDRKHHSIYLSGYDFKIKLFFDLPSGTITDMTISQGNEINDSIRLEPSDFNASPKEIVKKFGYPDELYIYNEYAFEFNYTDPSAYSPGIRFFKDSSTGVNRFNLSRQWIGPNNIKIGDTLLDIFEKLYIPDAIKNLGISPTMNNEEITGILNTHLISDIRFDLLTDYSITVHADRSGIVRYISVSKFNNPQYPIERSDSAFVIPVFDRETIASKADLYMSGCKFGSTRQEVFQLLGSPRKTEAGYDEYTDNIKIATLITLQYTS